MLAQGNHLVTRAKSNAVAYEKPRQQGKRKRGRPKIYGKKVALNILFHRQQTMAQAESPVYGEKGVTLQYRMCDLLWHPAGQIVRFVAVIHPTRGRCLLMSTDRSLSAIEIIRLYGLRFKIEHTFKQAVRVIGTFSYHFWMMAMKPLRRRNGNQFLHKESKEYRKGIIRKINAYHVFVHAGIVSRACFSTWQCAIRNLFGTPLVHGFALFALALRHPSWLLQPHCVTLSLIFSWVPRITITS